MNIMHNKMEKFLRNYVMRCMENRGLHGCGGHGDSAGPAGNPRGRLRSVRGIRGIGFLTALGHRGAGARREVTLHAAHAQHQVSAATLEV